jgi:hypothetical protein
VSGNDSTPVPKSVGEALANQELPGFKWKIVAQIGGALAVLWVTAFVVKPFVGYWGVGVVSALTSVVIGFGVYLWRMTRRSAAVLEIMKGATDEAGRARALDQLAQGGGDVMKQVARAQLLAQTDPIEAQRVLEAIDLKKAGMLADDVRVQLAVLYLRNNHVQRAREQVDAVKMGQRPDARSKALYAAVSAEALARTGDAVEARKLLETYDAADPAYGEARVWLLRAQVYACVALKKRGLARKAIDDLISIDPNLLGGFMGKGAASPELNKLVRQALAESGLMPKVKWQM